jgi:cytochrome c biogenesis factor
VRVLAVVVWLITCLTGPVVGVAAVWATAEGSLPVWVYAVLGLVLAAGYAVLFAKTVPEVGM